MKKLCVALGLAAFLFTGCATTLDTIGNGVLDDTEAADIKFYLALAFVAQPEAVSPAAAITDLIIEKDLVLSAVDDMGAVVRAHAEEAGFLPAEIETLIDAAKGVKAKIKARLGFSVLSGLSDSQRYEIGKQIIQIVNESAKARM